MTKQMDKIRQNTDAKRKQRSKTIAPKLTTITNTKLPTGGSMYMMLFKSPSQTTKGKFYKVTFRTNPKVPITKENWESFKKLKVPMIVNCSCPDFQFRWEYVLWSNNSARIENIPAEFRYDPDITNPEHKEAYCKHVLASIQQAKAYLSNKTYDQIRPSNVPTQGIRGQDVKDILGW